MCENNAIQIHLLRMAEQVWITKDSLREKACTIAMRSACAEKPVAGNVGKTPEAKTHQQQVLYFTCFRMFQDHVPKLCRFRSAPASRQSSASVTRGSMAIKHAIEGNTTCDFYVHTRRRLPKEANIKLWLGFE